MDNKPLSEMTRQELKDIILNEKLDVRVKKSDKNADIIRNIEAARPEQPAVKAEVPVIKMGERKVVEEKPQTQKQIVPIFIGCQNPDVIKIVTDNLMANTNISNNAEHDFDIVIMGQEVLESSVNQYFFGRLQKDNQDAYLQKRNDELLKNATLKKAIELEQFMRHYLNLKSGVEFTFTPTQLKLGASAGLRKELSNKEVREVVDLLSVFDFIQPTKLNTPYIKQYYKFTFSDHDMLQNTKWLVEQAKQQKEQINDQLLMLKTNQQILENKINNPTTNTQAITDGQDNNGHLQSGTEQLSDAGASEQTVETE